MTHDNAARLEIEGNGANRAEDRPEEGPLPGGSPVFRGRSKATGRPSDGAENRWLAEEPKIRHRLERMAAHLTPHHAWHQDLVQEALIHWWQRQHLHPGQSSRWYLRSCEFHLRNWLRRGRSIDSLKHRNGWEMAAPSGNGSAKELLLNSLVDESRESSVLETVTARDLVRALECWLTPAERKVLACLTTGLGTREAARRLRMSHTWVSKTRRAIAAMVVKLEPDNQRHASSG